MAYKETIALVCLAALVSAQYPEPAKKQKGYEYNVHKEYSQKENSHPSSYEPHKRDGYQKDKYGQVSVKKYGYKKEYGSNTRSDGYDLSEHYNKPIPHSGYESNSYNPRYDDKRNRSPYDPHKPAGYTPHGYGDSSDYTPHKPSEPHGYDDNQKYEPSPSYKPRGGYQDNDNKYNPYRSLKHEPHGNEDSKYEPYRPENGYGDDNKNTYEGRGAPSYKPRGYGDDSDNGYRQSYSPPKYTPNSLDDKNRYQSGKPTLDYQPREEKTYHKGYHKEEYYHNDKKDAYEPPSYGPKPSKNQSTKKVVHEKHYYGNYAKDTKPERALGGFEGDLHKPVYQPQNSYHGNGHVKGQLRGYEAAFARHKYYQLAPHYNY